MSQDYSEYLAVNVLNEQQIVSYRSLSRALKVHNNLAKQMLYEFHRKSSAKKPGSVHATYLISGRKHLQNEPRTNGSHSQNDGDKTMQSSPPLPSSSAPQPDENTAEPIVIRIIMLAKEEHLDQAKKQFEHISTIHVYSLQANGLSDVQALTECNRKIAVDYASEDPLKDWKQYGTIQNPNVQRRTTKMPPPPPVPVEKDPVAKTKPFATTAKAKEAETKAEVPQAAAEPERKGTPNPIQVKRQNSDIFKSFAKGKTKSKETSQSSKEASPAAPEPEDEPMGGFSDDDDTAMEALEEQQPLDADAPGGKSKKEREAELQAMMDQEDEAMEDATESAQQLEEPPAEVAKAEEEPAETATVENGRRRGKRRIMKKKKVKDEEGYLVTIEEAAWESFSEEEPEPKKAKMQPGFPANGASKPGIKKGGKPGQGNIMTFFPKK